MRRAPASQRQFARKLLRLSLDEEGRLDPERVEGVLTALRNKRPPGYRTLLKLYHDDVRREERANTLVLEHAGPLDEGAADEILKTLRTRTGRPLALITKENPDLLAGLRIRVGDDLYDASLATRLHRLS